MIRLTLAAFALALSPAAAIAADAPSPTASPNASASPSSGKPAPLRHLSFAVTMELRTQSDTRTIAVSANRGGNTEHFEASGQSQGTITCDVVGVAEGNLLVDVTEVASDRSSSTKRVALQRDGGLVFLPNQGPLNEEESELISLLAPGLMGGERAVGESWTFRQSAPGYTASKTFHLSDVKNADEVSLDVEEVYSRTGSDPMSGTVTGKVAYDPGALVPLNAKLDKVTRQEDTSGFKSRKLSMEFTLSEDSRAKR